MSKKTTTFDKFEEFVRDKPSTKEYKKELLKLLTLMELRFEYLENKNRELTNRMDSIDEDLSITSDTVATFKDLVENNLNANPYNDIESSIDYLTEQGFEVIKYEEEHIEYPTEHIEYPTEHIEYPTEHIQQPQPQPQPQIEQPFNVTFETEHTKDAFYTALSALRIFKSSLTEKQLYVIIKGLQRYL